MSVLMKVLKKLFKWHVVKKVKQSQTENQMAEKPSKRKKIAHKIILSRLDSKPKRKKK